MKTFGWMALARAVAAPTAAAATSPMTVMHYYVGTWSCKPKATLTFSMDAGVLSEHIVVAPSGKLAMPFVMETGTAWDATKSRYVTSDIRADGHWWASVAMPWTGNTERWRDIATDGKLGRETVVRTDRNSWTATIYSSTGNAAFHSTCERSS